MRPFIAHRERSQRRIRCESPRLYVECRKDKETLPSISSVILRAGLNATAFNATEESPLWVELQYTHHVSPDPAPNVK